MMLEEKIEEANEIDNAIANVTDSIERAGVLNLLKHYTWVAFGAAFSYFLFAPVEYYFSNKQDLWYDLYDILPIALGLCFCAFLWLMIIGILVKNRTRMLNVCSCVVMIITIGLYVQGNFVITDYGKLNGEEIDWNMYSGYSLSSVLIWLGIACLIVTMYIKYSKDNKAIGISRIIMICLVLCEIISLILIGMQNSGFKAKREYVGVTEGKWNYSQEQNLCILVLDTFDARVFENTLEMYDSEEGEEYILDVFENFTFFRDTMGAFSLTDYAIPQIISGESYMGGEVYGDYIERAYTESPLLNRLRDEEWIINIHSSTTMPQSEGRKGITNLKKVRYKISDYVKLVKIMYGLVNFRYFPTPLKKYVYCDGTYLYYTCTIDSIDGQKFEPLEWYDYGVDRFWDNNIFYYGIKDIEALNEKNTMHLYHLKGLHALRDIDENFNVISDSDGFYSLEQETTVVIKIIDSWLDALKEKGVYDSSIIMIMGDHGSAKYGTDGHNYAQSPVLMVKGIDECHEFSVSEVPLSYDDLQDIYAGLLDGMSSEDVASAILDKEDLAFGDYDVYSINELVCRVSTGQEIIEKTGRTRKMIYHFFTGNLGDKITGDAGYELSTEYPTFYGVKIEATGNVYK